MSDLVEFLLARIAEDEEWARLSARPDYSDGEPGTPGHSTRVLAECQAKRRIAGEHAPIDPCDAHNAAFETVPCDTLRLLALPYAAHPDYREEWKP